MYKCSNCGKMFVDPVYNTNSGGSFDTECPYCESWNYSSIKGLPETNKDELSALRADNDRLARELDGAVEDISKVAYHQKIMPCVVCQHWEDGMIDQCLGCHELSSHFIHRGLAVREGTE